MKAWFRGIEKGRTVYQKIGYVDRCGTIGFLQGFSSFLFKRLVFLLLTINRPTVVELSSNNCRTIIRHMSDDNKTVNNITFINIVKLINKIIYIIVWFIK